MENINRNLIKTFSIPSRSRMKEAIQYCIVKVLNTCGFILIIFRFHTLKDEK